MDKEWGRRKQGREEEEEEEAKRERGRERVRREKDRERGSRRAVVSSATPPDDGAAECSQNQCQTLSRSPRLFVEPPSFHLQPVPLLRS